MEQPLCLTCHDAIADAGYCLSCAASGEWGEFMRGLVEGKKAAEVHWHVEMHKPGCASVSHRRSDDGGVTFRFPPIPCDCGGRDDPVALSAQRLVTALRNDECGHVLGSIHAVTCQVCHALVELLAAIAAGAVPVVDPVALQLIEAADWIAKALNTQDTSGLPSAESRLRRLARERTTVDASLTALQGEAERLTRANSVLNERSTYWHLRALQAEAHLSALTERLARVEEYTQHNETCEKVKGRRYTKQGEWGDLSYAWKVDELCKCTCGLDDLLSSPPRADQGELNRLRQENARLKAGNFTKEEIHDICHDLHGTVDARGFADGCVAEQRRLYGCAPDADVLTEVENLTRNRFDGVPKFGLVGSPDEMCAVEAVQVAVLKALKRWDK